MIEGIKAKNEVVMDLVINQYSKLMWHIVSMTLNNIAAPEDIEECVADVFVYLWQNHDKFDEQRGSLKSWLSVIAKSNAVDRFRRLSKSKETELNEQVMKDAADVLDDIITLETNHQLISAINTLAEPDREIIVRRFYYQQKPKQIGVALNLPVKQVENRIYRSKLKLRETINNENRG
jgi:RNA polymerase sigma-70 factor (ECF subfamily)